MDFLRNIEPSLVTLHGYLRIIPPDVCERHEIYNGHPGLITEYPELKGKDPQEKVWITPSAYATIGSVVHECTPGVDEGPIVATASMPNDDISSKLVLYTRLRKTSLEAWLKFFAKRFE
jgi:phosphoribosylglycinamide formyltransferase-1